MMKDGWESEMNGMAGAAVHQGERHQLSQLSLIRALIPFTRALPHDPVPLQVSQHWGLGFNIQFSGDTNLNSRVGDKFHSLW